MPRQPPTADSKLRREFMPMPNIGPATADDLVRLGIRSIADLKRKDAMRMYDALAKLDGVVHDPCVLDTLMAAVHFAKTGEDRVWWSFTPERKALLAPKATTRTPTRTPTRKPAATTGERAGTKRKK